MTSADERSRARRFLDAFHGIEKVLQQRDPKKRQAGFAGFKALVRDSRELTSTQVTMLGEAANLRNVIAHDPWSAEGEAIADPRESEISRLKSVLDLLRKPPTVYDTLPKNTPTVLSERDEVSAFFDLVKAPNNFSQAPVREENGNLRLITTNAVTRWVASEWQPDEGAAIEGARIGAVLPFCEEDDLVAVKPRDFKVVHAIRLLSGLEGTVPAAIVLTDNGYASQVPLALCVRSDLPVLYAALHESSGA